MSIQLRIILAILMLLTLAFFIQQIKKKKLKLQYTLTWLLLIFFILLVTIFPNVLSYVSAVMGIALPINMIFFVGFLFTLAIIYGLTMAISKQSEEIKDLAQKIALLEKKLNENNK